MKERLIFLSGWGAAFTLFATSCAVLPHRTDQPMASLGYLPPGFAVGSETAAPPVLKKDPVMPMQPCPVSETIELKTPRPLPALKKGPRYFFPSDSVITVYDLPKNGAKNFPYLFQQVELLKQALGTRPNAALLSSPNHSPTFPWRDAAQAFCAKLEYFPTKWGAALGYVTQYTQDGGSRANNEELCYYVQGLTSDGQCYVSATFSLRHPKLPAGIDSAGDTDPKGDYTKDQLLLDAQPDNSFIPPLASIIKTIAELKTNETAGTTR